jgi:hypothetical protein
MASESDSVNTGALATIVVVGSLVVLSVAFAVTAYVRAEQDATDERNGTFANLRLVRDLKNQQTAELTSPATWVDRAKGTVQLPIEQAMALVADEIHDQPSSATPLPVERPDAGAPLEGQAGGTGNAMGTAQDAGLGESGVAGQGGAAGSVAQGGAAGSVTLGGSGDGTKTGQAPGTPAAVGAP